MYRLMSTLEIDSDADHLNIGDAVQLGGGGLYLGEPANRPAICDDDDDAGAAVTARRSHLLPSNVADGSTGRRREIAEWVWKVLQSGDGCAPECILYNIT